MSRSWTNYLVMSQAYAELDEDRSRRPKGWLGRSHTAAVEMLRLVGSLVKDYSVMASVYSSN